MRVTMQGAVQEETRMTCQWTQHGGCGLFCLGKTNRPFDHRQIGLPNSVASHDIPCREQWSTVSKHVGPERPRYWAQVHGARGLPGSRGHSHTFQVEDWKNIFSWNSKTCHRDSHGLRDQPPEPLDFMYAIAEAPHSPQRELAKWSEL